MPTRLQLEFMEARSKGPDSECVRLVARSDTAGPDNSMYLTAACRSLEEIEHAVASLKEQMDSLVQEARALFHRARNEGEAVTGSPQTLEEIWDAMEGAGNLEEMRRIFNELDPDKRRELADFVFTHKNVFKGAAALFSQHYNEGSGGLE